MRRAQAERAPEPRLPATGVTATPILTLDATVPGTGVGTALLAALHARARDQQVRRVWLVTTNDNTDALRFYQRRGYDLAGLHRDAVAAVVLTVTAWAC